MVAECYCQINAPVHFHWTLSHLSLAYKAKSFSYFHSFTLIERDGNEGPVFE